MSVLVPGSLDGPAARGETGLGGGAGTDALQQEQELWGSHPSQVLPGKAGAGQGLCQGCPHLIQEQGRVLPGVCVAGVADGRRIRVLLLPVLLCSCFPLSLRGFAGV